MEKIKSFFKKDLKEYFCKYLLTNIFILALTITLLVNLRAGTLIEIFFLNIVQLFAVESTFKDKKERTLYSVCSILIALLLISVIKHINMSLKVQVAAAGYIMVIILAGIYEIVKNSKLDFGEYVQRVFENLLRTVIVYLILEVGVNALVYAFSSLILDYSPSLMALLNVQIILAGFYLVPMCILSFSKINNGISKVLKNIIFYVITPLIIIAYAIIYIYVLKILLTLEVPKDTIFMMMSILFAISYFVWTILYKMDNKFMVKTSKAMPLAFIPLYALQVYSMVVRIVPYGFTEKRYMCVMLLIVELVAIILSIVKNRKYEKNIILVTIALIVISTMIPGINMEDVSDWSTAHWPRKKDKPNYTNSRRAEFLEENTENDIINQIENDVE